MQTTIQHTTLQARDLQHVWHPCSQMKDYETFLPLPVKRAHGPYLELENGQKIIDAISSWWCKNLGHGHPRIKHALQTQLEKFEHVILANTTNETIVTLSERLCALSPNLNKVMYASDGSCAVEMAMKMSLHAHQIKGEVERQRFAYLENAYHGETAATLSVSDLGLYRQAYEGIMVDQCVISGIPYVTGQSDPLWHDCSEYWPNIEVQLEKIADQLTAIIVEPILQGAGGMLIYSADFLKRLGQWSAQRGIHLIADEILTGLGRVGSPLACQHAEIEPDFLCVAKGLTAGVLPMSAMLTSDSIYNLFYDDYEKGKSFLHSHTHTGNALAAAVALEVLAILEDEAIYQQVRSNQDYLREAMQAVADETRCLHNIRQLGGMVAADLNLNQPTARLGYQVYQEAVKKGALLRPLGNTIYWLLPLNIEKSVIHHLQQLTALSIQAALKT